jgi:hypothetical protein
LVPDRDDPNGQITAERMLNGVLCSAEAEQRDAELEAIANSSGEDPEQLRSIAMPSASASGGGLEPHCRVGRLLLMLGSLVGSIQESMHASFEKHWRSS